MSHGGEPRESGVEIGHQVVGILETDVQAVYLGLDEPA